MIAIAIEEGTVESGWPNGFAHSSPETDEVRLHDAVPNHSSATDETTFVPEAAAEGEEDGASEESGPTAGPTTAPRSCSSVGIDPHQDDDEDGPTCPKKTD